MKYQTRHCTICDKEFETVLERIGTAKFTAEKIKSFERGTSKEGVLFSLDVNPGRWFCNECWDEILDKDVIKLMEGYVYGTVTTESYAKENNRFYKTSKIVKELKI